nr:MAG TPA: hypothetical protein [Caudoviricetes sp.]
MPANSTLNRPGHASPSASSSAMSSAWIPIPGRWRPSRRCPSAS